MMLRTFLQISIQVVFSILILSCGGDNSPANPESKSTSYIQSVFVTSDNSPNGGVIINVGIDSNGDGALIGNEINSTEEICHGVNGTDGTNGVNGTVGANGIDGIDGTNGLVKLNDEVPGVNCEKGGYQVQTGIDINRDSVLDRAEVTDTT